MKKVPFDSEIGVVEDKYKLSMFNNLVESDDNLLIFNSNTKTFRKVEKSRFESWQFDKELKNKLLEAGILVEATLNESNLIYYQYNEFIYDSTLRLTILASEDCNFRCSYCYEKFERGVISLEICDTILKWLRKSIKNYTAVEIYWFGGEPLLGIKRIEYLSQEIKKICSQAKRPFSAAITTNGYLLNQRNLNILLENGVRSFTITLDGIEKTHDLYRKLQNGGKTFERIIYNLKNIRDNCKLRYLSINIRCNLTRDTVEIIEDYMKMMHKEFYDDCRFSFFFRPAGDWGGERVKEIQEKLVDNLDSFYSPIVEAQKHHPLNLTIYASMLMNSICNSSRKNYFVIGSDGSVYKCTVLFDYPENRIGSLTSDGKMLINQQKDIRWVTGDRKQMSKSCESCPFTLSCFERNCPAKGWLLSDKGKCGYEKYSMKSIMTLLDMQGYFQKV